MVSALIHVFFQIVIFSGTALIVEHIVEHGMGLTGSGIECGRVEGVLFKGILSHINETFVAVELVMLVTGIFIPLLSTVF